jgi:hypothetical protein
MKELKRILLAVTMTCIVSTSLFAFDQGDDQKRPPKPDRPVVVVKPRPSPPPNNSQDNKRNDNKRGRP